ncbi:hypothetical protein AX17_002996 [Amanita inopinata Kibby_2008]|nr:hypothetical protein AX17_002996 [Amanita inopinata Kibby_2008]
MSTLLRQATNAALKASAVRNFSSSAVSRKDIIQDIYLREIRAYKPAPVAKDAHVGVVKSYSLPPTPKAPTLPTDLATELSAYDALEPTLATRAVAQESAEEGASGADEYLNFLEQDIPKPQAHH